MHLHLAQARRQRGAHTPQAALDARSDRYLNRVCARAAGAASCARAAAAFGGARQTASSAARFPRRPQPSATCHDSRGALAGHWHRVAPNLSRAVPLSSPERAVGRDFAHLPRRVCLPSARSGARSGRRCGARSGARSGRRCGARSGARLLLPRPTQRRPPISRGWLNQQGLAGRGNELPPRLDTRLASSVPA